MLVKFKGEYTKERGSYGGCAPCGTGRSINGKEVYKTSYRTYYGGTLYIFNKDEEVEVDDILGKFLLTRKYTDINGKITPSFEEVTKDTVTTNDIPEQGKVNLAGETEPKN